ncbi:fatty acid desaturase [Litoreibacter ponti]|uniref:Fatty acid desaturase n=1 Tax=Litoreibacter ponti TaxID=1510457 RepID=A0A2T6BL45_9RHOB|nr:fatty acid desaturase [Litoreibacter ponti]PTX56767.1 fatty acid desaturase [Litoreibacter ponti]
MTSKTRPAVEWPTVALLLATYGVWAAAVFWLPEWSLPGAVVLAGLAITQHASLQHEVIHGHPFLNQRLNAGLVRPALSLVIPYGRFRDTHLAHHRDANLTDPYDDPETNFLSEATWRCLPEVLKAVLRFNNTLLGRVSVGPLIGLVFFFVSEVRGWNRRAARSWAAHVPMALGVVALVAVSPIPIWAYLCAVYLGLALLKIRTFLEHRAHDMSRARSVIVEDRGPLALLFLNNNFHAVHHMHPHVAWYDLPAMYRAGRDRFLACNGGYRYSCYGSVFARYLVRAKDPVAHPNLRRVTEKVDA